MLPKIGSKSFELGPLKPLQQDRYLVHNRRKSFVEKDKSPRSFRSLDLRELDEKKLAQSFNLNLLDLEDSK